VPLLLQPGVARRQRLGSEHRMVQQKVEQGQQQAGQWEQQRDPGP